MSRSFLRHTSLRDPDLAAATEHPQRTLSVPLSALASRLRLLRNYTMYVNDEHYCLTLIPENSQNGDLQLEVSAVNSIDSSRSRESKILVSHDVVPLEKTSPSLLTHRTLVGADNGVFNRVWVEGTWPGERARKPSIIDRLGASL